jgi:RNA polymerase sigma-B factor
MGPNPSRSPSSDQASVKALPRLRLRNRLVEEHHDLVRPIALHYARRSPEPAEDLQQAGLLGLIRAAELYRSEQGTPFSAFARPHIRGAILHHLRDVAPSVRLPRRQAERLERLLRHDSGGTGGERSRSDHQSPNEADELPEEERELLLRQRRLCRPLPLEGALLETIAAQEPEPVGERSETAPSAQRLRALLEQLEPRQRCVVVEVVLGGSSYRRLAQELGVSPMTVKRLLQQGLDSLRGQMESRGISRSEWTHPVPSAAPAC